MTNEAQTAPGASAPPEKPSLLRRLALAVTVGVFAMGGLGTVRHVFAGGVIYEADLIQAAFFFVAPFMGAVVASAAIKGGGFFRPGFVGLTAFIGLIVGMFLGGQVGDAPQLLDYLPHFLGAFVGAAIGTSWTRAQPRRTPLMNIVLLIVLMLAALLLMPILLRA